MSPDVAESLAIALDRIGVGAAIVGGEGRVVGANGSLCALLGRSVEDLASARTAPPRPRHAAFFDRIPLGVLLYAADGASQLSELRIAVANPAAARALGASRERLPPIEVRGAVVAPLVVDNMVFGTITVVRDDTPAPFDDVDVAIRLPALPGRWSRGRAPCRSAPRDERHRSLMPVMPAGNTLETVSSYVLGHGPSTARGLHHRRDR